MTINDLYIRTIDDLENAVMELGILPFFMNSIRGFSIDEHVDPGIWAWWAEVHGVAKSRTRLSDFTFAFHFHALEKEMATHSSIPAWRIPETEEPSGLPSMRSLRVGHD